MRRTLSLALVLIGSSVVAGAHGSVPDCVQIRTSAPYRGIGYDHIVHIQNGCDTEVACRIKTNVNPDPIDVTVAKGSQKDVVTFRGSPARTFRATVDCEKKK